MRRFIVLVLLLFSALPLEALDTGIQKFKGKDFFTVAGAPTTSSVIAGATASTDGFCALEHERNFSALFRGVGTTVNYTATLQCSFDGVSYVAPEVGYDLGTFTDSNYHIVPVAPPVSECIRVSLKNNNVTNNATNTTVFDGKFRSQ